MAQPLTDAINALTTYANSVTGKTPPDTTLSDAVATLASGYGGGGAVTVASGEFVGGGAGRQTISIGKKMARTDFYLLIKAKTNATFIKTNKNMFTYLTAFCHSKIGHFDLSSMGKKSFESDYSVNYNDGTEKTISVGNLAKYTVHLYTSTSELIYNTFNIIRDASGFQIYIGQSNNVYSFPSDITYEYEIVYFGSNPSTDIVDLT